MKQQEKAPQARGECHTHCPKEELGEYRSSKHCEQQMTTGTSAGALSVTSVVKTVTQLRVGPPALIRPAFALYPALPSSLRSVPRPPASPQKLPLARPSPEAPPPRATLRFPFFRRRRPNPDVTAAGPTSNRKQPLFPGIPLPCGTVEGSSGPGRFSGFLSHPPPPPPPSSSTEADRVRGQRWRRTLRSGCTRSSPRWSR